MALPSLDKLRRNVEKLREDIAEPPHEQGWPFGYVPPELEEVYREWVERDRGKALAWRMRQPGFDFQEVIRRCAAARDDETQAETMRRNEERRRARGLYDDEDEAPELEADERPESQDLERRAEPENEECVNRAVHIGPEGPQKLPGAAEPVSRTEDDLDPPLKRPERLRAESQTETPKPTNLGSPWNPRPRSIRDDLWGW